LREAKLNRSRIVTYDRRNCNFGRTGQKWSHYGSACNPPRCDGVHFSSPHVGPWERLEISGGTRSIGYFEAPPIMSCGVSVIEDLAPVPTAVKAMSWSLPVAFTIANGTLGEIQLSLLYFELWK
jgi:hypothetical protein